MDRTDLKPLWENQDGWLVTVNGTKVGKVVGDNIEIYDKKAKVGIPFSINDFKRVVEIVIDLDSNT